MQIWLGASMFGRISQRQVTKVIEEAIRLGFYGIDTAPLYGDSEKKVGIALKSLQTSLPISSKSIRRSRTRNDAREAIESSIENLGLSEIEYYFIHSVSTESYENYLPAIEYSKQYGLVKNVGYSGDGIQLINSFDFGLFSCVMATLNIFDQANLGILEKARQENYEVFIKRPLANSFFKFHAYRYHKIFQNIPKISKPSQSQFEYYRRCKAIGLKKRLSVKEFVNFQKCSNVVDHVVFGVSSIEHLQEVAAAFNQTKLNEGEFNFYRKMWTKYRENWEPLT
jgi:aryl-alcohol dehydrogenase-like predicted oxidoreductase